MSIRTQNYINGRLSLRAPQAESLAKLKQALDAAPEMAQKDRDVAAVLNTLKAEFSTLEDFEREFPSLCFALATGVGKTRLMGAFIAYLHLAHGINNFFVLAPNLTIYNKLIADFTPNTPKYVFKGISEFAVNPPKLISGDNYEQQNLSMGMDNLFGEITINVFNISKINSEVRGGKEPKIKRMREVLGDSYFNYLANLPDLVLLMDESHRYRAQAGMRAINELNPLFGLELTATPFVESTKAPIPFKNVIVDYPLARAMDDGFVKMPAVVTQRNFDAKNYTPEEIEKIKLEDGVRVHENTKVELMTYARENNVAVVKPFMLVIARDTTHAAQLLSLLESDNFYNGRYQGKVIQVDSSKSGKDEEEMIERLLAVESVDEPTEIVIHVNMLKEGWDVTNLYTIVPLRAANARTLIEQSIGRGLRLPYGKRTGVEVVDRLNIIAHDRFQEIIDEANKGDSVLKLKQVILDAPSADDKKISVQVYSGVETILGLAETSSENTKQAISETNSSVDYQPVFKTETEKRIAHTVMEAAAKYATRPSEAPTSQALLTTEIREKIVQEVQTALQPIQGELPMDELDIAEIVAKTTEIMVNQTIDIPRITVVPSGEVSTGFHPFKLDLSSLHLQPSEREITIHNLHTNEQSSLSAELGMKEKRPEDYIVFSLMDFDDIDYFTQADLLYDLAGQMVAHLRGYLSEEEVLSVLDKERRLIAREIHAQMMAHFWEKVASYEALVSQGFSTLKPCNYTVSADEPIHSVRQTPKDVSRIKQMLFGSFSKCLYPLQKFDSDTERRFAVILEREARKWFKPAQGQFQIYWKSGFDSKEYIPDFVVETEDSIWLVETKAGKDLKDPEVLAKADAAFEWCKHATDYALQHNGKHWRYVLIPHDEVAESKKLADFLRFEKKSV
ncbi:DEAD/DEAH box helicase [Neisseria sicca]|uniref:DEAD/DEAH box helicase n=1 Tax=Neisseria sicca TaxID=490 RepID=UPI001ADDAF19|nr:DEAD/DEAH box helicase family protein [Neisseria sicca]QTM24100.1 DEAD/DEAH box helicase family protein [Neisseria sicca]